MRAKSKLVIAIFALAIVVVIFFGSVTLCSFVLPKKAVIILPGLFASGLYDTETEQMVWDPFYSMEDARFSDLMKGGNVNMEGIVGLLADESLGVAIAKLLDERGEGMPVGAKDSLFNMIAVNPDGTPKIETVKPVPWTSENRLRYGVVNAQREMQETLEKEYGSEYDVQVFNYDFRLDGRVNGKLLEDYINAQGYTEVILVSHSNGGIVAATYLARSEENRNKVSKYISYNVPYLGSFAAITILENLDGMVDGAIQALKDAGNPFGLAESIEQVFELQFKNIANMWPVYQLLPSYELLSNEYEGDNCKIIIDDEEMVFESETELWEFYCSRPWAFMKDENGQFITDENGEKVVRPPLAQQLDFIDSMKVTMPDGTKVHSTTLVDTTYFSGEGVTGITQVYFRTESDSEKLIEEKEKNVRTTNSDGTVLLASATAGITDKSKIRLLENADHYALVTDYAKVALQMTIDAINASKPWYNFIWNF